MCLLLHRHEGELDPAIKSNSLPVPQAAAYRTAANFHQPNPPVLQSNTVQPHPLTNDSDNQSKTHSENNRESLQKRIQLLQDHNLKLLSHIKVFREAIDKVITYIFY